MGTRDCHLYLFHLSFGSLRLSESGEPTVFFHRRPVVAGAEDDVHIVRVSGVEDSVLISHVDHHHLLGSISHDSLGYGQITCGLDSVIVVSTGSSMSFY